MEMINQVLNVEHNGRRQCLKYAQKIISEPPIDLGVLQDACVRVPRDDSVQRFALTHWVCYRDFLNIRSYQQ